MASTTSESERRFKVLQYRKAKIFAQTLHKSKLRTDQAAVISLTDFFEVKSRDDKENLILCELNYQQYVVYKFTVITAWLVFILVRKCT